MRHMPEIGIRHFFSTNKTIVQKKPGEDKTERKKRHKNFFKQPLEKFDLNLQK